MMPANGYMVRLDRSGPLRNSSTNSRGPSFSIAVAFCEVCVLVRVRHFTTIEEFEGATTCNGCANPIVGTKAEP